MCRLNNQIGAITVHNMFSYHKMLNHLRAFIDRQCFFMFVHCDKIISRLFFYNCNIIEQLQYRKTQIRDGTIDDSGE